MLFSLATKKLSVFGGQFFVGCNLYYHTMRTLPPAPQALYLEPAL